MFISAGNADWLAPSRDCLPKLRRNLVYRSTASFFRMIYAPLLPHEYQFNLKTEAGQLALERTAKFITARSH